MKVNKFALIIIVISCTVMMSSCWDYREINNLAIVSGFTVDKDADNKKYKIAVEVIKLESKGTESIMKPQVLYCEGSTVFEAVRHLIRITGKKLYWSHAKIVIFGEGVAREGIGPVLDWIVRDAEVRSDMYILISKEKTAAEILSIPPIMEDLVSFEITTTIQERKSTENYKEENLWHIINDFSEKGTSDIVPVVGRAVVEDNRTFSVNGSGVFVKDKLVGWLSGDETKDVIFVRDEIKDGVITIENVEGTDNNVVLEILSSKTIQNVNYKDGRFVFDVDIKLKAGIAEINGNKDFMQEKNRDSLIGYSNRAIEERIKDTVEKVQSQYGSDIFKFNNLVERKMPEIWKKAGENWGEEFRKSQVNVNVELDITGSAETVKPVKIEE